MSTPHNDGKKHLVRAIGPGSRFFSFNTVDLIATSDVDPALVSKVIHGIESSQSQIESLLKYLQITPQSSTFPVSVGLFSSRSDYEAYLKKENLGGLGGSLGATHPVRLSAVILTNIAELKSVNPAVVAAHEFVHLYTLKSGLCPGWDAWPRWLHEGLAMQVDHLAGQNDDKAEKEHSSQSGPKANFISLNPERVSSWRKISGRMDIAAFLKRDLTRNLISNDEDYAACWAVTHGLLKWKNGTILSGLINQLAILEMQFTDEQPIEIQSAAWLIEEMGSDWPLFLAMTKKF